MNFTPTLTAIFSATILVTLPALGQDEPAAAQAAGQEATAETPVESAPPSDEPQETPPAETGAMDESARDEGTTAESDTAGEGSAAEEYDSTVVEGGSLFESTIAEAGSSGDGEAALYQLNGYVRGDAFVGWIPETTKPTMRAGYGEAALKLKLPGNEFGDGYAELRFRQGIQGEERQLLTDLREAYVNAYLGPIDLRLGQQIIVWGRAHAFNPTNNLTPMDLSVRSPVDDDRRVANFGLRANARFEPVRVEGVWLPLFRGTRLPTIPLPEYVTEAAPYQPSPELANSLVAGRLHLELTSFEMSVSVLNGYAPLPGIGLESYTLGIAPPAVEIERVPYRHTVYGFDFSTILGSWGLRAEAAYRVPENYAELVHAPRPDLQYVVGIDHSFGDLSTIAQYMGRYTFDWQEDRAGTRSPEDLVTLLPNEFGAGLATDGINTELRHVNQMLFSQLAEVQHLAVLRLEYPLLHETLTLSALGMMNITTEEWLVMPKAAYKLSDAISMTVGAEYYTGPDGTGFGTIGELYSAAYSELRYTF